MADQKNLKSNLRNQPEPETVQPTTTQQAVAQQSIHIQAQEPLTSVMLGAVNEKEQKQMLAERLFPVIYNWHPALAGKITGILLNSDNSELLNMLEHHESLKAKVEEAVAVLQADHAKETLTVAEGPKKEDQEPLTAKMLADADAKEQKQMLGQRLFPLIHHWYPDIAGKLTDMLLQMENSEILYMLKNHESLKATVEEAVSMLQGPSC